MRTLCMLSLLCGTLVAVGCGGSVSVPGGSGESGGSSGSGGTGGQVATGGRAGSGGPAGTGGGVDASVADVAVPDGSTPWCFNTSDCAPNEWCDLEPAAPGMCSSGGAAGTCKPRPSPSDCPDYDECPGACGCNGEWYCDACEAHVDGISVTADDGWCLQPPDGGVECGFGFCRELVMSSCGDPAFIPLPMASCGAPSGMPGYCCTPIEDPCLDLGYCTPSFPCAPNFVETQMGCTVNGQFGSCCIIPVN